MGDTRSPCQAIVKPGRELLGFNVGPSGLLDAGPAWKPDPSTAVPPMHGDRGRPQVHGAKGPPEVGASWGVRQVPVTRSVALSKALRNSSEVERERENDQISGAGDEQPWMAVCQQSSPGAPGHEQILGFVSAFSVGAAPCSGSRLALE